jgi:hypothetical protein
MIDMDQRSPIALRAASRLLAAMAARALPDPGVAAPGDEMTCGGALGRTVLGFAVTRVLLGCPGLIAGDRATWLARRVDDQIVSDRPKAQKPPRLVPRRLLFN